MPSTSPPCVHFPLRQPIHHLHLVPNTDSSLDLALPVYVYITTGISAVIKSLVSDSDTINVGDTNIPWLLFNVISVLIVYSVICVAIGIFTCTPSAHKVN